MSFCRWPSLRLSGWIVSRKLPIACVSFSLIRTRKELTKVKPRYIRVIFELLNASSHAVKYEAATTLTTLTQNPAAVKAAASCFISLVVKESDNNVKLIVLDRLEALRASHGGVLDGLIMDILEVISSADMDVRRKAISIVLSMTSSRNVEEVVLFMKKQLQKTQTEDYDKVGHGHCAYIFEFNVDFGIGTRV
jgi:vesicle coat complex subunit